MKKLLLATAFSLFAIPVMGETPVTKWQWGCEWQQADNGDYWYRVDGGCNIHTALGYASANEMRGKDVKTKPSDDNEGPSDPGGEGPGDNGGGNEGPSKPDKPGHGYGDNNHDHSGPPGHGGDKPGKGKGKGRR